MPQTLILCPTFNHADTLFMSIASARVQTDPDWEMHVILDGAPDRTGEVIEAICKADSRIKYTSHPKAARHGEEYRDPAIRQSSAEYVVHLGDDDIWAPDHLVSMKAMLQQADWVNEAALSIAGNGAAHWAPINSGIADIRQAIIKRRAPMPGLNAVGYRRAAYLDLATGWTTTPFTDGPSDNAMWSRFLSSNDLTVASTGASTVFRLPSMAPARFSLAPAARMAELGPILAQAATPGHKRRMMSGATVLNQAARLFRLCNAANTASFDLAMDQAGLAQAGLNAEFDIAVNGKPMAIPLSQSQCMEFEVAHAAARRYDAEEPMPARYEAWLHAHWPSWIGLVRTMLDNSLATALRGADHMAGVLGESVETASLRVNLLSHVMDFEAAERALADCERQWPDHPRTRHAKMELAAARDPGPHQPWLHRQRERMGPDCTKP